MTLLRDAPWIFRVLTGIDFSLVKAGSQQGLGCIVGFKTIESNLNIGLRTLTIDS